MIDSQSHSVTPLSADMANFRPVSNVTFMSKIVKKVVTQQLLNDLLPLNQSMYRRHHSTETAMLCVISDTLSEADAQRVMLLALLDMTAAVDHSLFTALHGMQTRSSDENSVCPSVRPSVCQSVCHTRDP